MKYKLKFIVLTLLFFYSGYSQQIHTIMSYNLLNYPVVDTTVRNPYFRTIFSNIQPDILVVQEMHSFAGVFGFLTNVLNTASSGYAAGQFINGPDTDRAIFFKSNFFTFISNTPISTELRDINEFRLRHNSSGDTLIIYAVHLKANDTEIDRLKRAAEVDSLRKRTNQLNPNSHFIVLGDFNIYSSTEPAFQRLLNQANTGYVIDPLNLTGNFNNSAYSIHHTQSTRTRSFDDGAIGGMDDRFDMILVSQSIMNPSSINLVPNSTIAYGNDGNHYNDSINRPPNTAVGQLIADALHYASDHLPVYASFNFSVPVELTSFTALIEGLFNGLTMTPDTVTIELRNSSAPYNIVDQAKILLDNNGQGTGKFYLADNNVPYYLVVKHRNAIETWSSQPQVFTSNSLSYDFTTAPEKAYGNNLKFINGKWCIYSGDTNSDGFVEIYDLNNVFINYVNGTSGYVIADLNGDGIVDSADLNIVYLNSVLGIQSKRPPGF